jgi:hypothetical protein
MKGQDQSGREQDEQQEIQVPHAPDAAELEVQANHHQRRQVSPCRRIDFLVMEQQFAHAELR